MKKKSLFLLSLITVMLCSCSVIKKNNDKTDNMLTINALEQKNTCIGSLCMDNTQSVLFDIPVVVDVDLSPYQTNTNNTNDKLYYKSLEGENISDIEIIDYNALVTREKNYYVITFTLEVKAKNNWNINVENRKITKLKFNIIDKEFVVDTNIKIINAANSNQKATNCAILLGNEKYSKVDVDFYKNQTIHSVINFDFTGWGASSKNDPNYATIKRFETLDGNLILSDISIIYATINNGEIIENVNTYESDEIDYKLLSNASSTGITIEARVTKSSNLSNYNYINDTLVLVYTLNDLNEEYRVNVRNIQYSDNNSLVLSY